MTKRFMNPKGKILVAVNMDDEEASIQLLKAGASIAKRTGLHLAVLHVSEYWVGRTWPTDMMLGGALGGVAIAVEEEALTVAQDKLRKLIKDHVKGIDVRQDIVLGYPHETIKAQALTLGAELVIVGCTTNNLRFVPAGLSTVLGLLNEAPCSVLVIPKDHPGNWEKDRLSVVVSDDLSPQTENAIAMAYEWATAFGKVDLTHVHVNQLTKDDLTAAITSAAAAAHTPQGSFTASAVWEGAMTALQNAIQNRAPGRFALLEARGGTRKTKILHGEPPAEMVKLAQDDGFDLMIFGKHKTWHTKPFSVGQMPFHSMLKTGKPILVTGQ